MSASVAAKAAANTQAAQINSAQGAVAAHALAVQHSMQTAFATKCGELLMLCNQIQAAGGLTDSASQTILNNLLTIL